MARDQNPEAPQNRAGLKPLRHSWWTWIFNTPKHMTFIVFDQSLNLALVFFVIHILFKR